MDNSHDAPSRLDAGDDLAPVSPRSDASVGRTALDRALSRRGQDVTEASAWNSGPRF
jgi:hypothetical protein